MEKTVKKYYKDMQQGDVFVTEYGCDDNWVTIIFTSCEIVNDHWLKTIGKFAYSNNDFEGYEIFNKDKGCYYDVIEN